MKAFDTDPTLRWLFCLTHPDDELAIAAWIRRLTAAGVEVHLSWTHHTEVREREARAVAALLGVPESRLSFLGAPDGQVAAHMHRLLPEFEALVAHAKPDRVVTAAFEQGHLDHDATNFLVHHAFPGPTFEFPMYHPYTRRIQTLGRFASALGEEVLDLEPGETRWKKSLSRRYPSQNIRSVVLWYSLYRWMSLRPSRLARSERLRLKTHADYLSPNLPDPLRRQVLSSARWVEWTRAVADFEASLRATERAAPSPLPFACEREGHGVGE